MPEEGRVERRPLACTLKDPHLLKAAPILAFS